MSGCVIRDKIFHNEKEKIWMKPVFRQFFAATVSWNMYFVTGLTIGSLTVSIPQMRAEGIEVTPKMAAWFSSITGYGALPWILAPVIYHRIGLKKITILSYVAVLIGALNIYFCKSASHFLIGQALCSSFKGVAISSCLFLISDYTSPEYRGLCLTLKSASVYWGIWVANTIGTFFYWRTITVTMIIATLYCITLLLLPESPYWLASKRRFEECKSSFRWFRGSDDRSEKELEALISSEYKKDQDSISLITFLRNVINLKFLKPFSIGCLLDLFYYTCGKLVCSVYALEIFKKITTTDRAAYQAMLIMDAVTIVGLYSGCFLSKRFNRRFLLFLFSGLGTFLLFTLSLYLFLVNLELIVEHPIVSIILLSLFSIAISCGPIILNTSILAEIIPLNYRSTYTVMVTLFSDIVYGGTMQIAPLLFALGLHVAFLTYGILSSVIIFILYNVLPETSGRTLVEINDIFQNENKMPIQNHVEADKLME